MSELKENGKPISAAQVHPIGSGSASGRDYKTIWAMVEKYGEELLYRWLQIASALRVLPMTVRRTKTHLEFTVATKLNLTIHYALFLSFAISAMLDLKSIWLLWINGDLGFQAFFSSCFLITTAIAILFTSTNLFSPEATVYILNHCLISHKSGWDGIPKKEMPREIHKDPFFFLYVPGLAVVTIFASFTWGCVGYLVFWNHPRFVVNYLEPSQYGILVHTVLVCAFIPFEFFRFFLQFLSIMTREMIFTIGYVALRARFMSLISRESDLTRQIQGWKEVEALSHSCNLWWRAGLLPIRILISFAITLFCTFMSIRGLDHLPIYIYITLPFAAAFCVMSIVIVHNRLGDIEKVSKEKLYVLQNEVDKRRLEGNFIVERRHIKQLRPFGIKVAHFGTVTSRTWVSIFDEVISYLLLLLEIFV